MATPDATIKAFIIRSNITFYLPWFAPNDAKNPTRDHLPVLKKQTVQVLC